MSTIERTIETVTIYPGGYLAEIRHLENQHAELTEQIDDAERREAEREEFAGSRTLDEAEEDRESVQLREQRRKIAEQHKALVAEADEGAVHVKVQALPRRKWKALTAKHPPRTAGGGVTKAQAESDRAVGVNEDTFRDALVAYRDKDRPEVRTIIEPDMGAAELEEFLDDLSDGDFERLYFAAFKVNRQRVEDPKASLA